MARYERVALTRKDTGQEIMALIPLAVLQELQRAAGVGVKRAGRWVVTMQDAAEALAGMDLSKAALRLFLHLQGKLDYDNAIVIDQRALAERFRVHESQISRALGELVRVGVLERRRVPGAGLAYRPNPLVFYKGTAIKHNRAMVEATRRWGMGAVRREQE